VKISEKVHLVGFCTVLNNYRIMHGMYNVKRPQSGRRTNS
jgi:hypothetical protein